jgi:beta-glucosidase-like glycosyl hydrolase
MDDKNEKTQDDLEVELSRELVAAAAASLTPEEEARVRTLARISEAKAARKEAEHARRELAGVPLEASARREAKGEYLVRFFNLGDLLPDAPPEVKIPGDGAIVVRSPEPPWRAAFERDIQAGVPLGTCFTELVCRCTVKPDLAKGQDGLLFRKFLESTIGNGCAGPIGAAVLELGGARSAEIKRATR